LNAHRTLREETREDHAQVDAAFSRFDLSNLSSYGAFLLAQARAFLPVEAAAEAAGAAHIIEDWPARHRSELLMADLFDLGLATPDPVEPPTIHGAPAVLGAAYVLEGSRLGGSILRRQLPETAPRRFLSDAGAAQGWRVLTRLLDCQLVDPDHITRSVASARSVFRCFLISAEQGPHA
jgi:heme oxygenase